MSLTVRTVGFLLERIEWDGCVACMRPPHEYLVRTQAEVMSAHLCEKHAVELALDPEVVELVRVTPVMSADGE